MKFELYSYNIDFKKPAWFFNRFADSRKGYIIKLYQDRYAGFGDMAFLPGAIPDEKILISDLTYIVNLISIDDNPDLNGLISNYSIIEKYNLYPAAVFGLECALWNLFAAASGKTPAGFLNDSPDKAIALNALVPELNDVSIQKINKLYETGYRAIKLKVSGEEKEISFLQQLQIDSKLNNLKIRLDLNRRTEFHQSVKFLKKLPTDMIDYVEEPVTEPHKYIEKIKKETGLKIAIDESLAENPNDEYLKSQADVFIIKPSITGSLKTVFELKQYADANKKRIILSSAYESGIGMISLLNLASGLCLYPEAHGFDTYKFIRNDVFEEKLDINHSMIETDKIDKTVFPKLNSNCRRIV